MQKLSADSRYREWLAVHLNCNNPRPRNIFRPMGNPIDWKMTQSRVKNQENSIRFFHAAKPGKRKELPTLTRQSFGLAVMVIVFQSLVELCGMLAYLRYVPRKLFPTAS